MLPYKHAGKLPHQPRLWGTDNLPGLLSCSWHVFRLATGSQVTCLQTAFSHVLLLNSGFLTTAYSNLASESHFLFNIA